MEPQLKIKFTLSFIFTGWMMLLFMPTLPDENPANGVEIFIYALVNLVALINVNRWVKSIGN